eukprot:COSAG02_NODE_284_length_25691_cov_14.733354_14_plen_62_part_00
MITLPSVICMFVDFAVGPVFRELAKFSAAAREGTDAPGIRPQALEAILAALEANKAVHATR